MKRTNKSPVRLFYSYSHKDHSFKAEMEKALALLRQKGLLSDWSDERILPGHSISDATKTAIRESNIVAFLVSPDFIASNACREEWELAGEQASAVRVPIILSDCAWKDMDGMADLKALPEDGKPIRSFADSAEAWQQVYRGLKILVEQIRRTFTLKDDFRKEVESTEFLSQKKIRLQDVFVFPVLRTIANAYKEDPVERIVSNEQELLKHQHFVIHGERLSGKTALSRYLFLRFVDQEIPVLYLDLDAVRSKQPRERIFAQAYEAEFNGDYSLWAKQTGKVIILDNLSNNTKGHVELALEHYDRVIVAVQTDIYDAFYRDDDVFANFEVVRIGQLTHVAQEKLIRRRIQLTRQLASVSHGQIDNIENRVNEIIISNRILPRYPFYVLSILQTYEGFMPNDLSISSYGHCYYVLILAHFFKSGIAKSDDEINACVNFAEHLAYRIFLEDSTTQAIDEQTFEGFIRDYGKTFIPLKKSTLRRILHADYGIVNGATEYRFRSPYMYYFFLGKYLAQHAKKEEQVINGMVERSYLQSNRLTLIFLIHHSNDDGVIDNILLHTMCALDDVEPAALGRKDTEVLEGLMKDLRTEVLSGKSVESEREKERRARDVAEEVEEYELNADELDEEMAYVNDVYRILKNNEILGQILRSKSGSLTRAKLHDIIETIADSGLRLVQVLLMDPSEINEVAAWIREQQPGIKVEKIRNILRVFCFLWTMQNIEKIVAALNKPEIRTVVEEVVEEKNTPAYDLIDYFLRLDTIDEFKKKERDRLKLLLNKHQFLFFEKVLSIRTQFYLNTHLLSGPIEQSVCSLLGIKYLPKLKQLP